MQRPHYLKALERSQVLVRLAAFDARVVGTPPLGLDVRTSDIDVICFAPDAEAFSRVIWDGFNDEPSFRMWQRIGPAGPVVAGFAADGWQMEVFGQRIPVALQYGWRHFAIERRLLKLGGKAFHAAVLVRREAGMKTEPAFCDVLGLDGSPYEALLRLERGSDLELTALLRSRAFG